MTQPCGAAHSVHSMNIDNMWKCHQAAILITNAFTHAVRTSMLIHSQLDVLQITQIDALEQRPAVAKKLMRLSVILSCSFKRKA
jgi:hypothetical protein